MAVDFSKLLSKKADDCKPPPLLPDGTYKAVVGKYEFGTSTNKGTPFVKYQLQFIGAEDDVDETALAEIDLSKVQKSASFYLTESADYRFIDFCKSCGIKTEGMALNELIPEVTGQTVLVPVTQRLDKSDPTKAYNDIGDIVGAS